MVHFRRENYEAKPLLEIGVIHVMKSNLEHTILPLIHDKVEITPQLTSNWLPDKNVNYRLDRMADWARRCKCNRLLSRLAKSRGKEKRNLYVQADRTDTDTGGTRSFVTVFKQRSYDGQVTAILIVVRFRGGGVLQP